MKKYYEEIKMEIIELDSKDLILTSDAGAELPPAEGGAEEEIPSGGGDFTDEGFSNYH